MTRTYQQLSAEERGVAMGMKLQTWQDGHASDFSQSNHGSQGQSERLGVLGLPPHTSEASMSIVCTWMQKQSRQAQTVSRRQVPSP